ncbi:ATP synthase epsilon chain AtpC [Gottschalkia purinilytica]|uniref:ATP synthase epsilon chain n=1 Tax=Gottschalkia purinilytica TaxID=1503 RepID=A0A0L0WE08_GOTPU|nr:F0F1 ATP synthase subunit epsilon [Gottschalkia purinilytica]KNF09713.1 ATP synthase epsilon chain AtpC [Gottschalkia purinilytica]
MSQFTLEIVTPDRKFFEEEVTMVVARGVEGDIAILKNHIPIVTPLDIGIVKIKNGNEEKKAAIAGGYMEVTKEKTTIVTDSAEWPEEIDVERAKRAKERAENRLNKDKSEIDVARAELALKKALNRIGIAEYSKK